MIKVMGIQNMACGVICNLHKYGHVTAALKSLLRLKIDERILYKIAMLVYICKPGAAHNSLLTYFLNRSMVDSCDIQTQGR